MTNYAALPPSVLAKIASLDDHCLTLSTRLELARSELQRLRVEQRDLAPEPAHDEFSANRSSERFLFEKERLDVAIAAQLETCERLDARLRSEAAIATDCKAFLHNLPTAARLREVEARPGDLDDIREQIKAVKIEIGKTERTPVPSDDIADRVKQSVDALAEKARPIITGVGSGQALKMLFPLSLHADRVAQSGFAPDQANALLLFALTEPDRLVKRLLQIIADTGISSSERDGRLHALQQKLIELRFAEEATISALIEAGDDEVCRSGSAPWAVLMVEIEQQQRAAA